MRNKVNGVVYVATGERFVASAIESIKSLRIHEPEVDIELFTDKDIKEFQFANLNIRIIINPEFNWNDKITAIAETSFAKAIYIDVDTYVVRPFVKEIFAELDNSDLIVRSGMSFNFKGESELVTPLISQFNTGVIGFNSSKFSDIALEWASLRAMYSESKFPGSGDQPSFRLAVANSRLRIRELPSDFNFMGTDTIIDKVRIVHFAGVRTKIHSKRNINKALALSKFPPGTLCVYWLPIFDGSVHYLNLIRIVLSWQITQLRTYATQRGINRKSIHVLKEKFSKK